MGEDTPDKISTGETSKRESILKDDGTLITILKGQDSEGSLRFPDPDDMNPDEPWILRDPDKGLIRRYWRRKEIRG
jgi:hypothetical protein